MTQDEPSWFGGVPNWGHGGHRGTYAGDIQAASPGTAKPQLLGCQELLSFGETEAQEGKQPPMGWWGTRRLLVPVQGM